MTCSACAVIYKPRAESFQTRFQPNNYHRRSVITEIFSQARIFGNRFGTSEIPDNILEAIARTMLPDIREFFLSKEGQAEFAAWKAEQEKKDKKRCEGTIWDC